MPLPNTHIALPDWVAAQNPADWLTPPEKAVLDHWTSPKRRSEWLAGRLAVKRLLREAFGTEPLACWIGREGVAPVVRGGCPPGLTLSLSHSGGLGAASFCERSAGAIGIDVQQIRPVHRGLAARVLSERERAQIAGQKEGLLLLWALKEAAIKARRQPWGRALRDLEVHLTEPGLAEISVPGEDVQAAAYTRLAGGWWLARSVQSNATRIRGAGPDATKSAGQSESEPRQK